MLRDLVTAQYVHGNDGMGNSNFPDPQKQPENGNASAELVNYAEMYKKSYNMRTGSINKYCTCNING